MQMVKPQAVRTHGDHSHKPHRADGSGLRPLLEALAKEVPVAELMIVSTLPRESLQIAQPARVSEGILKPYAKGLHAEDRLTWAAILRRRVVTGEDAFKDVGGFESSRYLK